MRYLMLLLLTLSGCGNNTLTTTTKEKLVYHTAFSCDRNGCVKLLSLHTLDECEDFRASIKYLHLVKKDNPAKIIYCVGSF